MLEISKITKDYVLKDETVKALKGVDICFRRNEFVSILGPSGCGKTTLLNIIGGLDRYTDGDLIIDGKSTKEFKDKDWDNYRNHRVGFVFQNYNLIPHQTVLENVELALILSGVSKKERRARAIEVLTQVGLGDKLKSKPNQLSGGQMQRVAIARALVNDPEIILADEPTGALDSKTSVQIMELIKKVSKDRLVIMVTHNPELAEQYSTRIIRLLDGELLEDTKPYSKKQADKDLEKYHQKQEKLKQIQKQEEENNKKSKTIVFKKTEKKKSMSLFTALALSFKNLLTKKGRTMMVAFAGSIGIIGIALVLAVSAGMTGYINRMQSDSLSSYPVAISAVSVDLNHLTNAMGGSDKKEEVKDDEVAVYNLLETLKDYGKYNYISQEFVEHIKDYYGSEDKKKHLNALNISYASDMRLITKMEQQITGMSQPLEIMVPINSVASFSAFSGTTSATFFEGLDNKDYVTSLYDVHGKYPTEKNEIALVLNSSSVADTTLMSFGINSPSMNEDGKYEPLKYEDIINKKQYRLLMNDRYYDETTFKEVLNFDELTSMDSIISKQAELLDMYGAENQENTLDFTITAVLTLKEDASGSIFSDGLMYTKALGEYYRQDCKQSKIVQSTLAKYTYENGSFVNGDEAFYKNYTVNISELGMISGMIEGGLNSNSYSYSTPNEVKMNLEKMFKIYLTPEQVIDLCLQTYGASNIPTGIQVYLKTFEAQDDFNAMLKDWNSLDGVYKISYLDSSGMLTNMLNGIVSIISIVLVAFAAISLIVSSIMIGIITYTSVIERTKEIGVLRSVGASKKDVSRVFNAETIILGLTSGVLGIIISGILTILISVGLKALTGISGLAQMELVSSVVLIVVSMLLTFIAGLIPAKIASKKDPVKALRAE